MLRSMYAGISGMRGFQTKLDVVGNNIANVNTSGFKKGRVTFQDMMSQTTQGAQGPTGGTRGGINPMQVGLGSQVGSIDNIHTQGFTQPTGNPLDFAIEGQGMFLVGRDIVGTLDNVTIGSTNTDADVTFTAYTRAGNFYLDDDGRIVNADGYYLLGFGVDAEDGTEGATYTTLEIPKDAESFSVQANGLVTYVNANGDTRYAGKIALANFSNPAGLEKLGGNLYQNTPNAGLQDNDRFGLVAPQADGMGDIVAGALEMSNVDLAEEFTEMIVAQRGFQANTRIITTSDEILQELVNLKR